MCARARAGREREIGLRGKHRERVRRAHIDPLGLRSPPKKEHVEVDRWRCGGRGSREPSKAI